MVRFILGYRKGTFESTIRFNRAFERTTADDTPLILFVNVLFKVQGLRARCPKSRHERESGIIDRPRTGCRINRNEGNATRDADPTILLNPF